MIGTIGALLVLASPTLAAPQVDGEFAVSGLGTYNALTTGPDGNIWVTLDGGTDDVARISPAGEVQQFNATELNNPVGITTLGNELWVTQPGGVARFSPGDPAAAQKTNIATITAAHAITVGSDGHLWTASGTRVFEIPPGDPAAFQTYPGLVMDARGTAAGGDGNIWVADPGGQRIVSLTTDGAPAPGSPYSAAGGGPQGIAAGPGTQMAFTDPLATEHRVGRITPGVADPAFTPIGTSDPFGITFAADGAYWIGRFSTNDIGRLTPEGAFTTLGGFSANAGPRQVAPGPNNTLWVTLQNADKVARVTGVGPDAPPPPPPSACGGKLATVVGSRAGEVLTGTPRRDIIAALGGRDTLRGLAGNDILCGGRGRDVLKGGGGNDKLLGGPQVDRLLGGTGPDACNGGPGNDSAKGCTVERRL